MKRLIIAAVAAGILLQPVSADAQYSSGRIPRKWLVAGIGAALAGSAAIFYASGNRGDIGNCTSNLCVLGVTIAGGGLIGFLIGNEMDKLYNSRYRHAPPMSLDNVNLPLRFRARNLSVNDETVLVAGEGGVEVIKTGPRLERLGLKARGIRGIGSAAADRSQQVLLVGTGGGLYRFPLQMEDPGWLSWAGEVSAVSAGGRWLAVGLGPEFRIASSEDSILSEENLVEEFTRVVDLRWQGDSLLWVLTEERLGAYRVARDGTPDFLGEFMPPGIGRSVSIEGQVAALAAGSGGVYALDISDPGQPREITNWSGARFVYDVSFSRGVFYVAAGPEGLYALSLSPEGSFTPVGLDRNLGFVAAVETDGQSVYLIDRNRGLLRRAELKDPTN